MADKIYGIHQSQPKDIYDYMKANARPLGLVGRFDFLPTLQQKAQYGRLVGINDGIEMIVDDKIEFYDEPMMNGQVRRYAKITIIMAAFGTFFRSPQIISIEEEMRSLGYEELEVISQIDAGTEFSSVLGLDINTPYFNPVLFNAADIVQVKAGVPRYLEVGESIMDAPSDGEEYVRLNGRWVPSDHSVHASIDGGTATLNGTPSPAPSPEPSPSTPAVLVNYTPNYIFNGSSYDNSYENFGSGDDIYDTFGIERIEISNSFFTVHFNTTNNRINWSDEDRYVDINCTVNGVDYDWEGQYVLNGSSTYSTNTTFNYIHYSLPLSSSLRGQLADHVSSAGVNASVISLGLS